MNFGRYQVIDELGKGAMGVVYRAHDPQIDRTVALKVLRHDRLTSEDFISRFLKEAKAIGRLSHPNIVTVYDVGQDHDTIYIAMEFLEGKPLDEHMAQTPLTLKEINEIGIQIAETLDYAHDRGIVHRDIKPTNIIFTPEGNVKITDFGIAHIEDPSATQQTQAGEILGTPNYMAPEQVLGKPVDGRSDLYALGVLLYEMSTKTRPFSGKNIAVVFNSITNVDPIPPHKHDAAIPGSFSKTILKSMRKKPEDRFQHGKEMADELKAAFPDDLPIHGGNIAGAGKILAVVLLFVCLFGGSGAYVYVSFFQHKQHDNGSKPKPVPTHRLMITSNPTGAQFYANGKFKGNTPLTLDLPFGLYEFKATLDDYEEWEASLKLKVRGETPLYIRLIQKEK